MPMAQRQKFLGHSKLETTQVYAESSPAMMRESYERASAGNLRTSLAHNEGGVAHHRHA